jgi:hypothetical protein
LLGPRADEVLDGKNSVARVARVELVPTEVSLRYCAAVLKLSRPRRPSKVLATAVLLLSSVAATCPDPVAAYASKPIALNRKPAADILHRLVWDQPIPGRPGIHLDSGNLDGSGLRRIYTTQHGFLNSLSMDRAGRRVAFAPCCQKRLPALVVAQVRGGKVQRPLLRRPRFYFVGGIGWSPSGRRLVFQGNTAHGTHLASALWTVRPDGSGLRRVLRLPSPRNAGYVNPALAWTRFGVLYSDGHDLRVARHGASHLVLRHVVAARVSGNGRHIVTWHEQRGRRDTLWFGAPDGTEQRLLYRFPSASQSGTRYFDVTPNYTGRRILGWRESVSGDETVWWKTADGPETSHVISALGATSPVTWN